MIGAGDASYNPQSKTPPTNPTQYVGAVSRPRSGDPGRRSSPSAPETPPTTPKARRPLQFQKHDASYNPQSKTLPTIPKAVRRSGLQAARWISRRSHFFRFSYKDSSDFPIPMTRPESENPYNTQTAICWMSETKARSSGHFNLRKGRSSIPGQVYSVTWATRKRASVFHNVQAARRLTRCLKYSDSADWSRTLAFVVMPDHVHWLLELGQIKDLCALIMSVKSYSARALNKTGLISGPLWQPGFYDHAVRHAEDLMAISRYIVGNPLRAGLVSEIGQYPHWDAVWITG